MLILIHIFSFYWVISLCQVHKTHETYFLAGRTRHSEWKSLSHIRLWESMDCSPPGSSVHGILQARILEWVFISISRGSSQPRDQTWVSCIAGRFFTVWAIRVSMTPPKFQLSCCFGTSAMVLTHSTEPSSLNFFHQASYSKTIWLIMGQMPTS